MFVREPPPNISMEMLVSTITIINQRLERIDVVVCEKLSKLDQKIDERFQRNISAEIFLNFHFSKQT
jgi:hypothetical protein